jgi:hypothetical protein
VWTYKFAPGNWRELAKNTASKRLLYRAVNTAPHAPKMAFESIPSALPKMLLCGVDRWEYRSIRSEYPMDQLHQGAEIALSGSF